MKLSPNKAKGGSRNSHHKQRPRLKSRMGGERTIKVVVSVHPMQVPTGYAALSLPSREALMRLRAEDLRPEFSALAERWRIDTQHLSQISKKVMHESYFRIMGMGERAVPLLLEALRDNPAHWFVALKATTGVNPVPVGANPSTARNAWLEWGKKQGLIN